MAMELLRRADLVAAVRKMYDPAKRLAGQDGSDRPSQGPGGPDEQRVHGTHSLYAQAEATRKQSQALAGQLQATQRKASENWQLIRTAWGQAEEIRIRWLADHSDADRLRYSAHARLQARMASMPVIEQAKGILMAQYGWPEEQAFEALRRASQRENVKVRDLAAGIVARAVRSEPASERAGSR
jgi:hypothetical protein